MFGLVTFAASSQGPRRNSLRVARTRSKSSNTSINVVAWMWRSCKSPLLYAFSALKYQDGARFARAWVSLIHLLSMTHWHNTWRVTSTRSYKYEGWWLRLGAAARRSSQAVRTDDIGYQVRSLEGGGVDDMDYKSGRDGNGPTLSQVSAVSQSAPCHESSCSVWSIWSYQ